MTKVIWLGEDTETVAGPSFNIWNGVKFPKGVAVEVTDPYMLGKLKGMGENRFYKVIEDKQEKSHGESQTQNQGESIEDKGDQTEDFVYKEKNSSGYSPVKKKVRKRKPTVERTTEDPA